MARKIQFCALIFTLFLILSSKVFATPIDDILASDKDFSAAVAGISVKELNSSRILYQKNQSLLVHPASTLKFITSSAVYDYLGEEYKFRTALYKSRDTVYLLLAADPLFTYADMKNLVSQYASRNNSMIKKFVVDDSIIDKNSYGIGWQWDDNADSHFPQMSPYILNRNLFMIGAKIEGNNVVIESTNEYKERVINNLTVGESNNIKIERNLFRSDSPITLSGTVNSQVIVNIPALNPEQLFSNVLIYHFINNNIPINIKFKYDKLPRFCALEAEVLHDINDILTQINKYSDNLAAEILVKHAGHIKTENRGTTKDGLDVVRDYYRAKGLDTSSLQIVDGSGVSMNDYVSADFITDALNVISKSPNFATIKNSMATPADGTFKNRVPDLVGKIFVKTGTLANTSAVIGYMKTNTGKDVVFAIMLDNLPNKVNAKLLENKIIKAIYQTY